MADYKLRPTRGQFKLAGLVNGTEREKFISEQTFKSGATKKTCSFGVKTGEINESWVSVEGFIQDEVMFSKYDKKTKIREKKKISWDDRNNFNEDGFYPMFSVKSIFDGEYVNEFPYDACKTLEDELFDNKAVYVEGNIKYSSYNGKKYKNFEITKIMDNRNEIDFEAEDFTEVNIFEQEIILQSIEKHPENEGEFVLTAYVVMYGDKVETVEFIIKNKKLATKLKGKLEPYNMIKVLGRLENTIIEDDSSDDEDAWGDDDAEFKTAKKPVIREMVITKAYPSSIDTETYTEELISSVLKADEDYGADIEDNDFEDDEDIWGDD